MADAENLNDGFSHVSYDLYKDYTRTGSMKLSPTMMRLVVQIFFDKMELCNVYTVTDPKGIKRFYAEIDCLPTENMLKVKKALQKRFPQPGLVKDFIDAHKIKYVYSQSTQSIKLDKN